MRGDLLPFMREDGELKLAWPQFVLDALDALKAPGDVVAGKEPDPEGRAFEMAMALAGLGGGTGAALLPENSLGIFAGGGSKTANNAALRAAHKMQKQGASPTDILQSTGWSRAKGDRWQYEIPDHEAKLRLSVFEEGPIANDFDVDSIFASPYHTTGELVPDLAQFLPDILEHPELYAAYPSLQKVTLEDIMYGVGTDYPNLGSGSYSHAADSILAKGTGPTSASAQEDLLSVLLHEVQHAVQGREGFPTGGTPWAQGKAGKATLFPDLDEFEVYRRIAGETQARNVQTRKDWSPRMRRHVPPEASEDVPREQQWLQEWLFGPRPQRPVS